ncbi:conserved hypothetical protein [Ferrimonas sediminum]|uniref:Porin n=1 Tax=Ferrimonas sediminum TaxID=718193 RepID=A0A1G8ZZS2_9GAMM|nr:TorF family putative porin [Ferrimonas sediminum]SDK20629.1 conserved hypothetical protein [Ferrimonas sediminum]
MKKLTAIALTLVASQALAAEAPVSASGYMMGLSNYLWRGQSISLDNPSLQSDFMLEHELGLYGGVSYETYRYEDGGAEIKDYEIDYYGGYYHMFNDDLGMGLSAMKYTFGDGGDTLEYTVSVDYRSLSATVNYDEDVEAWYGELNYSVALFADSTLVVHGGWFTDAENYGYGDESSPADEFYDVALRYDYPFWDKFSLLLEASYHEYEDDHYMIGVAYWL